MSPTLHTLPACPGHQPASPPCLPGPGRQPASLPCLPGPGRQPASPPCLPPRSHPSDEKDFSFPRNISAGSLGSLLGHHHGQGAESDPHVTEPLIGGVPETRLEVEREVRGRRQPRWGEVQPPQRLQDHERAGRRQAGAGRPS